MVGFVTAADRFNAMGGCFSAAGAEAIPGPGNYT